MSTGTSLVAFKLALITRLTTRPGLAGVQIYYGVPEYIHGEEIWLEGADAEDAIRIMRAGTKKVDESYVLTLVVQVLGDEGQEQQTVDVRAAELLREVQQDLAENPQPIADVWQAQLVGWRHVVGLLPKGGYGSMFRCRIRAEARLFPS